MKIRLLTDNGNYSSLHGCEGKEVTVSKKLSDSLVVVSREELIRAGVTVDKATSIRSYDFIKDNTKYPQEFEVVSQQLWVKSIRVLDVWGNPKDGFEVNDSHSLDIPAFSTNLDDLLCALRYHGVLTKGLGLNVLSVQTPSEHTIYINYRKHDKPFLELYVDYLD